MDAFFSCAAAASKNADEALVKAMPFLFLFVIYISPIAWSFEQIGIEFYKNEPNFETLDEKYGWHRSDNHKMAAIFILVGMFVLFRGLEMVCLKYLHAPER